MHTAIPAAALSCALAVPAPAAPSIQRLEFADGVTGSRVIATDVSADGSVVSLKATFDGFGTRRPGYWTPEAGVLPFNGPDASLSFGVHVSDDASTFATQGGSPTQAYTWTPTTDPQPIVGPSPNGLSSFGDFSADGSVVVGTAQFGSTLSGYIYTQSTGVLPLPGERPEGISADGSVVAGTDRIPGDVVFPDVDRPWVWSEETGKQFIPELDDFQHTSITSGISRDGSTVFGDVRSPNDLFDPAGWRWSANTGLQFLDNFTQSSFAPDILDATADASILVGSAWDGFFADPAIWLQGSSTPIPAESFFASQGVTIPAGWSINDINAVSPDGRFFVGDAFDGQGGQFSWIIEIPAPATPAVCVAACIFASRRRRL